MSALAIDNACRAGMLSSVTLDAFQKRLYDNKTNLFSIKVYSHQSALKCGILGCSIFFMRMLRRLWNTRHRQAMERPTSISTWTSQNALLAISARSGLWIPAAHLYSYLKEVIKSRVSTCTPGRLGSLTLQPFSNNLFSLFFSLEEYLTSCLLAVCLTCLSPRVTLGRHSQRSCTGTIK